MDCWSSVVYIIKVDLRLINGLLFFLPAYTQRNLSDVETQTVQVELGKHFQGWCHPVEDISKLIYCVSVGLVLQGLSINGRIGYQVGDIPKFFSNIL
jgi:hypothetical protein